MSVLRKVNEAKLSLFVFTFCDDIVRAIDEEERER